MDIYELEENKNLKIMKVKWITKCIKYILI